MRPQDTPAEPAADLQLEIAHLLLIDVVGYSKLLVNEQIELLQELNRIVRSTECFRAAEARGELIRVPTGDGMALVFFHSPEEPARCALEISRALQDHPSIRLRMGVHSGPINRVTDAESTKNLERAAELDPQNPRVLQQISYSYYLLRRYADVERALDRAIAVTPKEGKAVLRASRAEVELDWHADTRPLLSTIEAIAADDPRVVKTIAKLSLRGSLCKRDFDSALRALGALTAAGCYDDAIPFPRAWCEGVVAQMRGDKAAAHAAFTSMRTEAARLVAEQPDYPEGLCVLGVADAALGKKEDAILEGRRAVKLLPVTKDSIVGALLVQNLALIYAWTGEKDLAFEQLTIAAKLPGFLSYGELRLHPHWDPLRGDPRFDKIVASLAPK